MTGSLPDIVLMHGRSGPTAGERLVEAARRASALDVLETLAATGRFGRRLVVTDDPALVEALAGSGAIIEPSGPAFHFGRRLAALVTDHGCQRLLYVGAGSGALVPAADWHALADLLDAGPVCCANNYLSADYVAVAPAEAVTRIAPPATDNDLSWRLVHEAGVPKVTRPKTLGSEVDIDTPTDVALLALARDALPPRLARVVARAHAPDLQPVLAAVRDPDARLFVAGRVSSAAWSRLETSAQRYTRLVSEERGMRASGRLERGEVRSLLGALLERAGPEEFFAVLAEIADVALLDTRVLFAHLRRTPSMADRFASDQLAPNGIRDPVVREFTAAAARAPLPVLLGGHGLVSGGLWLLAQHLAARGTLGPAVAS